jgi:hypothetical protein
LAILINRAKNESHFNGVVSHLVDDMVYPFYNMSMTLLFYLP